MVDTFIFFLLPLLFLTSLDVNNYRGKQYRWLYLLCCIYILGFSLTLTEKSGDFINYRDSFENIDSWEEYMAGSMLKGYSFEPLFLGLCLFIKKFITSNSDYAIAVITLLAGGGLLYYIPRYSHYVFIALVVYIAHFYWWLGIVLLRQMCAMVILFPLIHLLQQEKWKKSLAVIGLASLFHASALIFCVFLLLKRLRFFSNAKKIMVLIGVSFIVGYLDVFKFGISVIADTIPRGEVLMNYLQEDSGRSINVLAYVEMLLILIVALKYRLKLQQINKHTDIAIDLLVCSVLFGGVFYHYEIGARFMMYFNFYSYLILLPAFISIFRQDLLNRSLYALLLCFYMSVFLIRFVYITV